MSVTFDENWERWIFASVYKFVHDQNALRSSPYYVFIEGSAERATNEQPTFLEMRLDGPFVKQLQGFYRLTVELNVEISHQVTRKLYVPNEASGWLLKVLNNNIPVYKLGNLAGDDAAFQLGCLRVAEGATLAHKYGQIAPKVRLYQGTVEAKYWIDLSG